MGNGKKPSYRKGKYLSLICEEIIPSREEDNLHFIIHFSSNLKNKSYVAFSIKAHWKASELV